MTAGATQVGRLLVATALVAAGLTGSAAVASHDGDAAQACPAGAVPEDGFTDVPGGATHEAAIDCLVWWDVTAGRTWHRYGPTETVRRDQMASFVARLLEAAGAELPPDPDDHFDDDDGNPHERRIDQLAELGVVSGTGERTYGPHRPVRRGQTATLLVEGYERATGRTLPEGEDHFDDDAGSVHEGAIDAAAEAGWAHGVAPRRFAPERSLRRDEMASFLTRVLDTHVEHDDAVPPPSFATGPAPDLDLELVTDAVESPTFVTAPPGDDRLFVVERAGRVRVLDGGTLSTFLDLRSEVSTDGERGMFAIAFPPGWPDDGRVFASWTDLSGDSHVEWFEATPDGADASARTRVAFESQPASNHNGGMIAFGPDGLLWLGLGDGGGSDDQFGNGQDDSTPLGGLNRYDVTGDRSARPPGNVFDAPSLWAIGLRNPWRFAFDPVTDHLYVADVGQRSWEEVNVVPARTAGLNYGWSVMEGDHCFRSTSCDRDAFVRPVHEYGHDGGSCSITGGVVYRGTAIPGLAGHYLFSDLCDGQLRTLRYDGSGSLEVRDHPAASSRVGDEAVVSFGTDDAGEAYLVTFRGVYRIVAAG